MEATTTMSEKVLRAIAAIESERRDAGRLPEHALGLSLRKRTGLTPEELEEALEALKRQGLIEVGRTINDIWIRRRR